MSVLDEIAGDSEKGAERLIGMYGGRLTAAAMSLCGNETDAKDLVWDTVDVAVRQVEAYRGEAAVFEWLYGIMQNLYRHSRRRKSATNEIPMADLPDESVEGPIDGASQIVQEVDAGILRAAVDALPPDMRESIILRYFMDMPILQIAKFLSLPVGTVKSRLHYARIALARRLGGNLKKTAVALVLVALMLAGVTYAATAVISSYMEKGEAAPISETTPTAKENETVKTERSNVVKLGRKVRNLLAASSTLLAVMQGQAATLFFSPAEGDSLSWDNVVGWKLDEPPYTGVNRLPTEDDDVTLNSIRIALAGEGVTTPHALQIGNGVKAEARTVKIASADVGNDSTYAKTGRVIGMEIGNGGFLHTADRYDSLQIGASTVGYGVLTMTGGMISNYAVNVGYRGIGVMTNAGGTVYFRGQMSSGAYRGMTIGSTAGSTGTLAMTSGIITHNGTDWNVDGIMVGYSGEGTFELSGGVVSNRVLVGSEASGRGHVKMSGGTIVNRVFVGVESAEMNEFDFTGGTIVGDIYVGTRGRGRMTFDGGVHHVYPNIRTLVPSYTGASQTYGLTVGNFAGSHGELIVKKPGLTFETSQAEPALVCGRLGEGHVETFVDLEMSYLRVGGNSDAMSSYEAYAGTTTTVRKVALAGGYGLWEPSTGEVDTYPGTGEIVLSNAVLRFTWTDVTTPQLYLGRYEGTSFGILRGCGAVQANTPTGNNVRMGLGEGKVIGDGYGEQRQLDLNVVVSVTNFVVNTDDSTNGWYAVNKGAVLFPRVWLSAASDTRCIGTWTRNATPDFVNSVGFTLNNVASPGSGYYVRGGVYAADRSDVHADALPKSSAVVGIWKMGVFSDLVTLSAKSYQGVGLTFRYDHTKVDPGNLLHLYRWNGSAWTCVASARATENPRISCNGLTPVAGESYNIGTFALMCRATKGFRMIIR